MIENVFKSLRRREFMRQVLGAAGCIPLAGSCFCHGRHGAATCYSATSAQPGSLSKEDDNSWMTWKNYVQYFWEQANPKTGLVKDRCNVRATDTGVVGSIASTGFGLTALCIGENRGYISHRLPRNGSWRLTESLGKAPQSSWIFLSLGEHQHRRTRLGRGSFFGGYRNSAMWSFDVPRILSGRPRYRA